MVVMLGKGKSGGESESPRESGDDRRATHDASPQWAGAPWTAAAGPAYDRDHIGRGASVKRQDIDWHDAARASPLLAALPRPARAQSRLLRLPESAFLFHKGDRPAAMHFVLSGELRLVRYSRAGGEIVLQRARRGLLGEASLGQSAYHCDAVAAAPSALLAVPLRAFAEALGAEAFRAAWMSHLARELRRARAQVERLSLKTARERIVHYIETEGDGGAVALAQFKKSWAVELGLTHEALYRALAKMKRQGLLAADGVTLRLLR